jgi:hypothetical protein
VSAKIQTWSRDSFELLDYDATDVTKTSLKTRSPCFLIRTDTLPKFTDNPFSEELSKTRFLSRIQPYDSTF